MSRREFAGSQSYEHQDVRTTLTLDADVAALLKRIAAKRQGLRIPDDQATISIS